MIVALTEIDFFARIQADLAAVTDEQLAALRPGDAVPANATIVGELSPVMKVFLTLSQTNAKAAYRFLSDFITKNPEPGIEELLELNKNIVALSKKTHFYKGIFWDSLVREFGELKGATYGYGPNFEVYVQPQ